MLYRLLTENTETYRERTRQIMADLFPSGFTLLQADGFWKGGSEQSLVAEVTGQPETIGPLVHTAAERIGKANKQDAVLIQTIDCSTTFVSTKGDETMTGTTIKETVHGEFGCQVKLMTGLRIHLQPASNLPDDSPIKWWGTPPSNLFDDPRENEKVASIGRTIGFGFYADDVRLG